MIGHINNSEIGLSVRTKLNQIIDFVDAYNAAPHILSNGIDSIASAGTDVLNIGATNANVINYGNASTVHNFLGTAIYELQVNSYVEDKLITLNYGSSIASGIGVGFEIEENSVITGYFKTNAARNGFSILTPAIAYKADVNLDLLTANRNFSLPNNSGTLALISQTITNGVTDKAPSEDTVFDVLDGKLTRLFTNTTDSAPHTGTLTNTLIWSEDISNKLISGDIAEVITEVVRVSGLTAATIRYYLNSSASLSGATQIGIYSYGFSGLNIADFRRQLVVKSSTLIRVNATVSSTLNDYYAAGNYADVTVNLASLHIIFAITLGNTGDQFLVSSRKMIK